MPAKRQRPNRVSGVVLGSEIIKNAKMSKRPILHAVNWNGHGITQIQSASKNERGPKARERNGDVRTLRQKRTNVPVQQAKKPKKGHVPIARERAKLGL